MPAAAVTTRFITPLVHPASILRGRPALAGIQVAYLRRLVADPTPKLPDTSRPPPNCNPDPSLTDLAVFCGLCHSYPNEVIVLDIENAGPVLVCCGVLRLHPVTLQPDRGVCFRFRHQGGAPWWTSEADHLRAVELLDSLLGAPKITKVTHFGTQHDLPLLLDLGFEVRGPLVDTSVLLHAAHSELPKGLQFLATAFCGAPRWKDIPDEKETADTEDSPEAQGAEAD